MLQRKLKKESMLLELKMPSKQPVSEYMDYSTIHGIGRTKNSPYIALKICWVLALLASLAMIIWQVDGLYKKYSSHPISTSVDIQSAPSLEFPRVTICNTNPALYSKLHAGSDLEKLIQDAAESYSINMEIFNASDWYGLNYSRYDEEAKGKNISNDILWQTTELFKMRLSVKDVSYLTSISQPMEEFILLCNFAGEPCSKEAFVTTRSYEYGLCYEFDPKKQTSIAPQGRISSAGPGYALELLLFVDQQHSLPFVASSTGIAITTENGPSLFHPENSVFIPTGFETNVGLTQYEKKRVPGMFQTKRCKEKSQTDQFVETLLDCRRKCKQKYIFKVCDCYQYYFEVGSINESVPLEDVRDEGTGYRPCFTDADYKCIQRILIEFTTHTPVECVECLPPCDEISYRQNVSMVTWPDGNFLPILRRIIKFKLKHVDLNGLTRSYVRGNMALTRIYFSTLSYKTIKEEYAYSDFDFISDIGGQLGLWAGFSVLSLFEVIELVLLLCASARARKRTDPELGKEKKVKKPIKAIS